MRILKHRFIALTLLSSIVTACGDSSKEAEEQEPVDIEATEKINDKLLNSMLEISDGQIHHVEKIGKESLEELSEADRQSLIDLTIEESAEAISEDADKMVELLEDINGISD